MTDLSKLSAGAYSTELDIKADIGATYPFDFVWKTVQDLDWPDNPANPPIGVDLTDCTAVLQIKTSHESDTVLLSPPVELIRDGVAGAINADITPAQLASLLPRKKFVFNLIVTFPTTYVRKLVRGRFDLIP